MRPENIEALPIETMAEVVEKGFEGEPVVEILGRIQEFSTEKRVSFETRRYARTIG